MSMWLGPPAKQTMITARGDEALLASACSRKMSGKVKPPKPRAPTRKKPRRLKLAAVRFLPFQKVNTLGASLFPPKNDRRVGAVADDLESSPSPAEIQRYLVRFARIPTLLLRRAIHPASFGGRLAAYRRGAA